MSSKKDVLATLNQPSNKKNLPDKNEFIECVQVLLSSPNGIENRDIALKMAEMLSEITGISVNDEILAADDTVLESGIAISPVKAAKCLLEVTRTQVFLKGISQAIKDKADSNREINILYAGTGPYGTILLPLLPLLREAKLNVQCIDIHQTNVRALKKVASWLEIDDENLAIDLADATQWVPMDVQFDIIISETMNTFLQREPQVQIFANLCQFLKPKGELIPQVIRTSIEVQPVIGGETQSYSKDLLVLDKDSCSKIQQGDTQDFFHTLTLPDSEIIYQKLNLNTDLQVYREHRLGLDDCSLNIQRHRLSLACAPGQQIKFEYKLNDDPYWQIDIPNLFHNRNEYPITQKGTLGFCYIPRFWDKYRRMASDAHKQDIIQDEFELDIRFIDLLAIDLRTLMNKSLDFIDSFEAFESWLKAEMQEVTDEDITEFNDFCFSFSRK